MSDQLLHKMFESNAVNGGLWVKLNQALGHNNPLSPDAFANEWQSIGHEDALERIKVLISWFDEQMPGQGADIAAEIMIYCLSKTTLLRIIYSGDTQIEQILEGYLKAMDHRDNYLDLLLVLLEGEWDVVPTIET